MCIFCNYHSHTHDSNIYVPDSPVTTEDYVKRTKELDHKILTSMEHGYQGRYFHTYDLAKQNGLKFIFGTEAYWVKDRFEKDRTNSHICLFAKSEKGRRQINRILSEANINGYYYRPRIDLNLLSTLDPNEVFLTSACIAFWHYDDIEDIVSNLHSYFGKNFMLEVQAHHTAKQIELNKRILYVSERKGIDLIFGCDSHFIYPEQAQDRDDVLESKGVRYEDEEGWFMDYPDGETVIQRLKEQGVLNDQQIETSIKNTNIFLDFDDYNSDQIRVFNKNDIKLPTLYPELSQEERDQKYKSILNEKWKEARQKVPKEKHDLYIDEIRKEGNVVINTGMTDYFLIDYEIVKRGVERGGVITPTGRGSGVSFYTNTLLGFSKVDRIASPVLLYPERFMSESRILKTRSLPDLDLNLGTPHIFAQAQEEILGQGHSYPMIAYGKFKIKSAFKMYAKSQKLDFDISNEISKQLEKYENDLKYADEDEEDLIDVYDYVEEKYHEVLRGSEKYTGIISDKKPHPCGWLIYDGNIVEEIGLIMLKSESTKKEVLACLIDGDTAENYKFLKNDLLKVDVVNSNHLIYQRINLTVHTETELLESIRNNQKVWDIYEKGLTVGVNQVEKASTTQKIKRYKPKNISELTAFIAAIRPAFKSMYHIFESRKPFEYGIKSFDNLIKTEEMPNSFVLYQEQTMAALSYAGFPSDETYGIIKAISKKKPDIVRPLKERFLLGFSSKIIANEDVTYEEAIEMSDKVWQIIEDSSGYGFNASHAYSYALDSAYCAYLKSHYPLFFYETLLRYFNEKKKKHKVAALKAEMSFGFGIKDGGVQFRKDNRSFVADETSNSIFADLSGIKYMNTKVSEELFNLRENQYETFIDLLIELTENTSVDTRQIDILIRLNYFSEFGQTNELVHINEAFLKGENCYKKTYVDKTKVKRVEALKQVEMEIRLNLKEKELPISEIICFQKEHLGYADVIYPNAQDWYIVTGIDTTNAPKLTLYDLTTAQESIYKMKKKDFNKNDGTQIENGSMIKLTSVKYEPKKKYVEGKFIDMEETEPWISGYNKFTKRSNG